MACFPIVGLSRDLSYPEEGLFAEFQAFTAVADERWFSELRSAMMNFLINFVPLVSFQMKHHEIYELLRGLVGFLLRR